ncbi:MAG: hypothetical protein ACE5DW_01050 [Thermodesulfobacteriota bacterium]
MELENADRIDLLKRLLNIARAQKGLFSENRLTELAGSILERDEIISRISKIKAVEAQKNMEQDIIKEILNFDCDLRVSMEGALEETRRELRKVLHCTRAHRAYASPMVNMKLQR